VEKEKMIPRRFNYSKAKSLSDAFVLLEKNPDSKILAGGMSLIPVMKLRLASPKYLVDINGIKDLSYIKKNGDREIVLGALTRHNEIVDSQLIANDLPALVDAAEVIGDEQVRNMGTIGGALSHADPAADYAGVALAYNAEVVISSSRGTRSVRAPDFFVDTFTTSLKPTEIVTEVKFPLLPKSGGAYIKFERKAGDFATVGVGALIQIDSAGKCTTAGIGLVSAGPTPLKALNAERELVGKDVNSGSVIEKVAELAATKDAEPLADLKGDEKYKREMVKVFTERAVKKAVSRIK
jgi:aerobic carbon-monoxide dehydrogenase medium subunit